MSDLRADADRTQSATALGYILKLGIIHPYLSSSEIIAQFVSQ